MSECLAEIGPARFGPDYKAIDNGEDLRIEGLFFCGAFAYVYFLRSRGLLSCPGFLQKRLTSSRAATASLDRHATTARGGDAGGARLTAMRRIAVLARGVHVAPVPELRL